MPSIGDELAGVGTVSPVQPPPDPTLPPGILDCVLLSHDAFSPLPTDVLWEASLHGSNSGHGSQSTNGDQWLLTLDTTYGHEVQKMRVAVKVNTVNGKRIVQFEPADAVLLDRDGYPNPAGGPNTSNMETEWNGYIVPNNTTAPATPYTQWRVDMVLTLFRKWKYPQLPDVPVVLVGDSMGAAGAFTHGFRRYDMFTAIFASRPRLRSDHYPDFARGGSYSFPNNPMADVPVANGRTANGQRADATPGQTVVQRLDTVAYVANLANKIPFVKATLGAADTWGHISDFFDWIDAMIAADRPFCAGWNPGGHSDPVMVSMSQLSTYGRAMFATHDGFNLRNCSTDGRPRVDATGTINAGFSWDNLVVTPTSFSGDLTCDRACTVDVKPYSDTFDTTGVARQSLTFTAGETKSLSFSAGQASPENPPDAAVVSPLTVIPLDYTHFTADWVHYGLNGGSRYERMQSPLIYTTTAIAQQFSITNMAGGGDAVDAFFQFPRYEWRANGRTLATYSTFLERCRAAGVTPKFTLTGTPPPGMTFSADGLTVSGTPTAAASKSRTAPTRWTFGRSAVAGNDSAKGQRSIYISDSMVGNFLTVSYVGSEVERIGVLIGAFTDEADGDALFELYGVSATGVATKLIAHGGYIDRAGGGKDASRVWVQSGTVDLEGSVNPSFTFASVDKAAFMTTRLQPLPKRLSPPTGGIMPKPVQLTRDNLIVPCLTYGTPRKWCRTNSGLVISENKEPYQWQDVTRTYPVWPLIDGVRGVARAGIIIDINMGREGKNYCAHSHGRIVVDATGTQRTLYGLRHRNPIYWREASLTHKDLEIVGQWDGSIPRNECYPLESWGMCRDSRTTLAIALNAAFPQPENEPPHSGDVLEYCSDRHGYVLRVRYKGNVHDSSTTLIDRWCETLDAWGMDEDPDRHEVGVAERGGHCISAVNMDTGVKRTIIGDPTAAKLGSVPDGSRVWANAPGVTTALCRSHPIVAPEGLRYYKGRWYYASMATRDIRSVKPDGSDMRIECRPATDGNSNYINFRISDGTFLPEYALVVATWSNGGFGRPLIYLRSPNMASDNVQLQYAGPTGWQQNAYGVVRGVGGKYQADAYSTAIDVGRKGTNLIVNGVNLDPDYGALVCASSGGELAVYRMALPEDGKAPDYASMQRGYNWYKSSGHYLVHGHWLDGPNVPAPFGENVDGDGFMRFNFDGVLA